MFAGARVHVQGEECDGDVPAHQGGPPHRDQEAQDQDRGQARLLGRSQEEVVAAQAWTKVEDEAEANSLPLQHLWKHRRQGRGQGRTCRDQDGDQNRGT